MTERLSEIIIPVLILVGDQEPSHLRQAELLAQHLPQGKRVILPGAGQIPHHKQPRQLGHAMLDFLMHCERQRNLVRGASFLL
jgi:pimeloyl-ACP methyl ester carboxylesterase